MFSGIDFSSDTVTKPTRAMREAMLSAEVGDEQKGEDPTTNAVEKKIAKKLGKADAVFFPTATMANQVAIMLLCSRGAEVIAAEESHILFAEAGGPAVHAGVLVRTIPTQTGIFSPEDLKKHCRLPFGLMVPLTQLLVLENTFNMAGGRYWPIVQLTQVVETAKSLGLKIHLDGSRIFNAAIATQTSADKLCHGIDTITICFSKGLGCPTGAALAFEDASLRKEVLRLKHRMGGALRQSGFIAAGASYALDNHIDRLSEDHKNAQTFAKGLAEFSDLWIENPLPETNMVFFQYRGKKTPKAWWEDVVDRGVRFSMVGENRFRAVTHLDISSKQVQEAIQLMKGSQ